jgi:hypothetical protein
LSPPMLPPSPPLTAPGAVAVLLMVGVDLAPAIVMLNDPVPCPGQLNWTEYCPPTLASESTTAVVGEPGRMVTVLKTPEAAVAVVLQPLADRVTRPPGATVEGLTLKTGDVTLLSVAVAVGVVSVNEATPSRAADATRIARMDIPPGLRGAAAERISTKAENAPR